MKVTIKRGGGYDPTLGPKHPDNQDPTLVETIVKDDVLQRVVKINTEGDGRITLTEAGDDITYVTVMSTLGHATVAITAEQLWKLAEGIVTLFGGVALRYDEHRNRAAELRTKLFDVLHANESRCLDDNIDRDVVLRELLRVLS